MKENKMKPKRIQRHTGPNWQGKGGNTGDKTTLTQAKQTSLVPSPAQVKPFAGKVFYLDIPSNRVAETLESDIKALGGTVEKFFSKEIKYLVSNKREARYVPCLRQDSPVPSPDSGQTSPHPRSIPHSPGSRRDNIKNRSKGKTDTFVSSRGKSLVEKVVKEQERVQMNKILSNALEWGVKILYITDVIAYVQKKKKIIRSLVPATAAVKTSVKAEPAAKPGCQKYKGGQISKPFVKVEDSSRHYCPIYICMPSLIMPKFNLKTVAPCSPFSVEDRDTFGNRQREHRGVKASASEERAHGRKKNRDKKRGGYCECCIVKYDNLRTHLRSQRHKAFSQSEEYLVVDSLVSTLHCNFVHIKTEVKRPKCSVSSVLLASGPCGETGLRDRGALDPSETVKEEHRTVDGHNIKIRSVPGSDSLTNEEEDWMDWYTYPDTSKHKSLAQIQPCTQNSLTSCKQKAEQAQTPQFKQEAAPSRVDPVPSFPSRVTQVDRTDQIPHKDKGSSTSHFHNMNIQNEVSSRNVSVMKYERVEPDKNKDMLLFEVVQDRNKFPEKEDPKHLSEKEEEESLHTKNSSQVWKIQRKRRVYKHKRRKVDTNCEHVKPSDVPDNCSLKLWQLFQSSDDMDVEFCGFED